MVFKHIVRFMLLHSVAHTNTWIFVATSSRLTWPLDASHESDATIGKLSTY